MAAPPKRRNPRGYGLDLGAVTVRDPTSHVFYRPAFDISKANSMTQREIEDLLIKENDIKTSKANDLVQRHQLAIKYFHWIKDSPAWVIDMCHLLDIQVRGGDDFDMLKMEIYNKIRSDERNSKGQKYRDLFIQACEPKKEIADRVTGSKKEIVIQIRVAHMIKTDHKILRDHLRSVLGPIWEAVAYAELKKPGVRDIPIYKNYSCTLFDDTTLLLFDNTYKPPPPPDPEPLWREEDLVKSELL